MARAITYISIISLSTIKKVLTIDQLARVVHNLLDVPFPRQMLDGHSCKRSIDFKTLDQDGLGYELEGGNFLEDAVVGGFVEDDCVLCLVFYFSL